MLWIPDLPVKWTQLRPLSPISTFETNPLNLCRGSPNQFNFADIRRLESLISNSASILKPFRGACDWARLQFRNGAQSKPFANGREATLFFSRDVVLYPQYHHVSSHQYPGSSRRRGKKNLHLHQDILGGHVGVKTNAPVTLMSRVTPSPWNVLFVRSHPSEILRRPPFDIENVLPPFGRVIRCFRNLCVPTSDVPDL